MNPGRAEESKCFFPSIFFYFNSTFWVKDLILQLLVLFTFKPTLQSLCALQPTSKQVENLTTDVPSDIKKIVFVIKLMIWHTFMSCINT